MQTGHGITVVWTWSAADSGRLSELVLISSPILGAAEPRHYFFALGGGFLSTAKLWFTDGSAKQLVLLFFVFCINYLMNVE